MIGGFYDYQEGGAKRKIITSDKWRVAALLFLICISASLKNGYFILTTGLLALTLCIWAGVRWKYISLRLLLLIPFGLIAILLLPFSIEGEVLTSFLIWTISKEGLYTAGLLIAKLIICHFYICLMLSTTPPNKLLNALKSIGVPSVIIEIIKITLRYLSVLFEEIENMILAQSARGFSFRSFSSWSSYKRSGELLGVLLIRSYERSIRIHHAMLSRGLDIREEGDEGLERNRDKKSNISVS